MEIKEATPELVVSDAPDSSESPSPETPSSETPLTVVQALAPTTELPPRASKKPTAAELSAIFLDLCRKHTVVVPVGILLVLLFFHQIWLAWVGLVALWSVAEFAYPRLPLATRLRIQRVIPERWKTSRFLHEFLEGLSQVRPFIMFSLYMFCVPVALLWIASHWVLHWFERNDEDTIPAPVTTSDLITFTENRRQRKEEEETNFLHSPAFGLTTFALFTCGLPAAITFLLYQHLGMDALFGYPSRDADFVNVFLKIDLYIYSVSWAICGIFFRTWMTFPLNYTGDEAKIELTPHMVKRKSGNWMRLIATMNEPWEGRYSMAWDEVKYMGYEAAHMKLAPLPTVLFPASSIAYKLANKIAQLYDGISSRLAGQESIYFSTSANPAEMSSRFRINLSDLTAEQRASLFYAVRKWAPHVLIDSRVQDVVLGTTVMQAPRYTQMWFELLTDKMPRRRQGALAPGDALQKDSSNGSIEILSRLRSGGQANVYVARRGESEVVLKEFILSHADAVGALVESAGEFETESTLLSELQHDGIVRMLDFFAEDRRLYVVLEKLEGSSLREHVKTHGPLSESEAIRIGIAVSDILTYLHSQTPPVVHRDISPDNIMLLPDGSIKLIDFSLAAAKKSRRTTSTMGKHSYAPPEQLREEPVPASDIYALGATLAFLLTGTDPRPITQSDVRSKRADISADLDAIIMHATELDVQNRFSDVCWLRLELEKLRSTEHAEPQLQLL